MDTQQDTAQIIFTLVAVAACAVPSKRWAAAVFLATLLFFSFFIKNRRQRESVGKLGVRCAAKKVSRRRSFWAHGSFVRFVAAV